MESLVCLSVHLSICPSLSGQYLLNCSTIFFYQTWYGGVLHEVVCHAEKLIHYLQCQGHSKGLYNQSMSFYCVSETAGPFATKLGLIVQHHKPECHVMWKNGITVFKVTVTGKVQNVSECLSGRYLLNQGTFCCQTWYCYAAS